MARGAGDWTPRADPRHFVVDEVEIPIARLLHIITPKHAAGRDKDRLFLATHRDALEQLLKRDEFDRTSLEP